MANEIIKVLDALCEKFGIAIDWTSENVTPYLKELCGKYINYEIWTSVGWIVLCSVLFVVCLVITTKSYSKAKENGWYFDKLIDYVALIGVILTIILGLILVVAIITQTGDIITCLTFPEKILFEYVQGLISKG